MILHVRPPRPKGFPTAGVRRAIANVGPEGPFPDLWKHYKRYFMQAQCRKCAWCENPVLGEYGAVDHHAPKSEVGILVAAGQEKPWQNATSGRRVDRFCSGYWWLAWEWDNWLLSCTICNSEWKRTLFPVAETPRPTPARGSTYTSLLLSPFGTVNPLDHLEFDETGQISARNGSPKGNATITTCGLWRPSLVSFRHDLAQDAARHCRAFMLGEEGALVTLRRLADDRRPFAGVIRSIVRQQLGLDWSTFSKLPTEDPPVPRARPAPPPLAQIRRRAIPKGAWCAAWCRREQPAR